jgi:putative Holliday junction resolvase
MADRAATGAARRPGRAVGIDLGSRRIGVAVSDSAQRVALPHTTLSRSRDAAEDRRRLVDLIVGLDAAVVVVGLPLSLDGSRGPAASAAAAEADAMGAALGEHGIPVELVDERLTTVSAHQALAEAGANSRERRRVVDASAAAVVLTSWLERAGSRS